MTSKLNQVTRGIQRAPLRTLIYGHGGVGKSTMAARAESPIFLDLNLGTALIDCARYPLGTSPTFADVLAAIADLTDSAHEYRTLVIDVMGDLERLVWLATIERTNRHTKSKVTSIEAVGGGWNKGYKEALDEWRLLAHALERLRAVRQMDIVLLAHRELRSVKNPAGMDWDGYGPAMERKAADFWEGWVDQLLYIFFQEGAIEDPNAVGPSKKGIGWIADTRMVQAAPTASIRAKSRLPLPESFPLDDADPWRLIRDARNTLAQDGEHKALRAELRSMFRGLDEATQEEIKAVMASNPSNKDLRDLILRLRTSNQGAEQ